MHVFKICKNGPQYELHIASKYKLQIIHEIIYQILVTSLKLKCILFKLQIIYFENKSWIKKLMTITDYYITITENDFVI